MLALAIAFLTTSSPSERNVLSALRIFQGVVPMPTTATFLMASFPFRRPQDAVEQRELRNLPLLDGDLSFGDRPGHVHFLSDHPGERCRLSRHLEIHGWRNSLGK